jgi:hypothetical protein
MWQALLDRNLTHPVFTTVENMGIGQPELMTQQFLMEDGALSHLTELRTIIAARYNAKWGGSGDQRAAELVEQGLGPGLVEDRPGVFLPQTRSVTDEDVELVT